MVNAMNIEQWIVRVESEKNQGASSFEFTKLYRHVHSYHVSYVICLAK